MSLLFDNDVELPSDPPLHPLVQDSRYQETLGMSSLLRDLPLIPEPVHGPAPGEIKDTTRLNPSSKLPIPEFNNTETSQVRIYL